MSVELKPVNSGLVSCKEYIVVDEDYYSNINSYNVRNYNSLNKIYFWLKSYDNDTRFYYDVSDHSNEATDEEIQKAFTALLQLLYTNIKEPTFLKSILICNDKTTRYKTKKFHSKFKPPLIVYDYSRAARQIPYEYDDVGYNTKFEHDPNTITFKQLNKNE